MTLAVHQNAILKRDLPAHRLLAGDVGTVVEHHVVLGREDGYSVEFFDMTGQTVAVVTVPESSLRAPNPGRPTDRRPGGDLNLEPPWSAKSTPPTGKSTGSSTNSMNSRTPKSASSRRQPGEFLRPSGAVMLLGLPTTG